MLVEKSSGLNPFASLGGVPVMSEVRRGVIRCQGPFGHSILAGTFGASLIPMFVSLLASDRRNRALGLIGLVASGLITVASGSSGPVIAGMAGGLAIAMWPLRNHMRAIRWGFLGVLVILQMVMKAPVWFLMARVSVFDASTGFHRAILLDGAINHISGWWLLGTKSTLDWADPDQGLFDVTNQYLIEAADGGLLTMILFIAIIAFCFQGVGRSVRNAALTEPRRTQFCIWAIGAALFAHTVNYMSVSYFDQNIVNWYLLLAMIGTLTAQFAESNSSGPKLADAPSDERRKDWEYHPLMERPDLVPSSSGTKRLLI